MPNETEGCVIVIPGVGDETVAVTLVAVVAPVLHTVGVDCTLSPGSTWPVQAAQLKASATGRLAYRSETGTSRSKHGVDAWLMAMQHSEYPAGLPYHETRVCHDAGQKYCGQWDGSSARVALIVRAAS